MISHVNIKRLTYSLILKWMLPLFISVLAKDGWDTVVLQQCSGGRVLPKAMVEQIERGIVFLAPKQRTGRVGLKKHRIKKQMPMKIGNMWPS